jgi:DNA/RNA-binding protein KIN17
MMSLIWRARRYTLTDFVKYLGKSGQCRVDETEKGWFISVIQPDPAEALASERRGKRERAEKARAPLSEP